MKLKDILSHQRTGLAAVIVGCTSTATMVTGFVTSFTPLLSVPALAAAHDDIMKIIVPLGVISALCTFVANMAESIIKFEDNEEIGNKSDAPTQAPH